MNLQEFFNQNNGKHVEVAGSGAANQCVDLANAYIRDVLGMPIIEHADAKDFPKRVGDAYEWIDRTSSNFPQYGDIVIWDEGIGPSGHIDVCMDDNANFDGFFGFDQNWPLGSVCKKINHTYKHVDGWLRLKVAPTPPDNQPTKRYMKIATTGQMIWTKINDVTAFWVIAKKDDGSEVKRAVKSHITLCAEVFANNDQYRRWSTPEQFALLTGYPEGKEYDITEQFKNHPELFEKQ